MEKLKRKYDLILFVLLMVLLFIPIIQESTDFFPVKLLKGTYELTPKPELTFENYRSSVYQTQMEQYASENFGLREPVIRLYNQYVWSFYNKTYCHFIVPGKNGYLYYAQAVNDYYGNELLKHYKSNEEAMKAADKELRLMNKLRHVLKDYGIEFLAFMAPDKPVVYPEYLPRRDFDTTSVHITEYYARRMEEIGFPFVNMTDWFVTMRDTVSFPLFPKTDSHWHYSAIYGYDSLFRFMNALDGEAKFPDIYIGPPIAYESEELEGDEATLNLLFRIPGDKTKYKSEITVGPDTLQRKPKVLFIGDSFIWALNNYLPTSQLMADREIWFYNNTAYVGFDNKSLKVKEIDRLSHILNADYVVFYSAGHQWREATYDFAKDALMQLCVSDSLFEATVTDYVERLRVKERYKDMTEEELRKNAIWLLDNNPELIPGLDGEEAPTIRNSERINKSLIINEIKKDKNWVTTLSIYSVQHGLSLDDVLQEEVSRLSKGGLLIREETVIDTTAYVKIKKQEIINKWRNNRDQMRKIQQKAKDKNRPVEVVLEQEAQWAIDQKIKKGELFQ